VLERFVEANLRKKKIGEKRARVPKTKNAIVRWNEEELRKNDPDRRLSRGKRAGGKRERRGRENFGRSR